MNPIVQPPVHDIRNTRSWPALTALVPQFKGDPREHTAAGITLDLTTAGIDENILSHLLMLAEELNWAHARDDLFAGKPVNISEKRPALHMALRAALADIPKSAQEDVRVCRDKMNGAVARIEHIKPLHIIHVGIGGSSLGPMFLQHFLGRHARSKYDVHFINNADPETLMKVQAACDPGRTVVIIASKSFATEDVMLVAHELADWLKEPRRIFAITGRPDLTEAFGIDKGHVVPIADWLGGRFSIWGGVYLPILLNFCGKAFEEFLSGARAMDQHFRTAAPRENLPLLMSLAHLWQRDFIRCAAHAIVPYTDALYYLPPYIQQLEMESNGKIGTVQTAPVIFGGMGTTVQHSFMQWLHQGPGFASVDFILPHKTEGKAKLVEFMRNNALAQSAALAHGTPPDFLGGHPSNLIFMDLTPVALGALLALYEHKIFLQAHFWGINCFDQPGVELGKRLAREIKAGKIPRSTESRLASYKG